MSNQINPTNVTTGQVRLSYTHLFKPYAANPNQEAKYTTTILIPKSDIATKQRLDAAVNAAVQNGINSKWNGVRPPQLAIPIHDGDGPRPSDGMPFGEECKGHWVLTASSKQQQAVVDLNLNPIINETEVYSGVYARVNINFFAYNSNGKKGIGCGLGPVQKIADGEPLGGRVSVEAAFGDGFTTQPSYTQPGYPQVPAQPVYPGMPAPVNYPPATPAPQQQQIQCDPITGAPISGGVMGI